MKRILLLITSAIFLSACDRTGCTDPNAANYDDKYESDDGSCMYDSEPFEGRWEVMDSLKVITTYVAEPIKILDIRAQTLDRSKVKFFFRFEDGSYSDTLDANALPNTLSIPEQTYADTLTIQGNFTIARIGGIKVDYRLIGETTTLEYRGIGTEL